MSEIELFTSALKNYVVTPISNFGLSGFVFDIEEETTINLRADITDHFIEDNTTIQDHIAIKPKRVTLRGFVGELVYRPEGEFAQAVQTVARKLTVLSALLPELSKSANSVIRTPDVVTGIVAGDVAVNTENLATNFNRIGRNILNAESRQQEAYLYFKALMEQRILVSLQTPFEYVNRMAIESVVAVQSSQSRFVSEFTITLKEIRVAEILTAVSGASTYTPDADDRAKYQDRAGEQEAPQENLGTVGGVEAPIERLLPIPNFDSDYTDAGYTPIVFTGTAREFREFTGTPNPVVVDMQKAGAP